MPHIPSVQSSPTEQQSPSSAVHHATNEEYKEEYEASFDDYISDSDIPDDTIAPASAEASTSIPSFTSQGLPSIGLLAPSLTEAGRQHYADASLFGRKKKQQHQISNNNNNNNTHNNNKSYKNHSQNNQQIPHHTSSVHIIPTSITSPILSTPSIPTPQHTFLGIHMIKADTPTSSTSPSPSPSSITCDDLQLWLISTDSSSSSSSKDPTSSLYLRACPINSTSSYLHIWIHPHDIHQVHVIGSYRLRILDVIQIMNGNHTTTTTTSIPDCRVYVAVDKLTSTITSPSSLLPCLIPDSQRHLTLSTSLIAPSHITCARSLTDYHDSLEFQLSCCAVQHDKSSAIPSISSISPSPSPSPTLASPSTDDVSALPSSFAWSLELSIMRLYGSVEAHATLNASQLHSVRESPIQCRVADHYIIIHTIQTDTQVTWTSDHITSCGPFLDISLGITVHRDAASPIQSQPSSAHVHLQAADDDVTSDVDPSQLSAALDALFDYHSDSEEEK